MSLRERTAWPDIATALERLPAAILPVGATEQHGSHVGCGMDAALQLKTLIDIAKEIGDWEILHYSHLF